MDLQILSDLHLDHHADYGKEFLSAFKPVAKTLIIAGDLCGPSNLLSVARALSSQFENIIYVMGNHEYYNQIHTEVLDNAADVSAKIPNFHWLENNIVELDGQRFLGTTLWFKKNSRAPKHFMNDFSLIINLERWVYEINKKAINFLNQEMKEGDIVITHHLPSYTCVPKEYKNDILNPFFVCEMDGLIIKRKPKLWVFGHTHFHRHLNIGKTEMICNPVGYPLEGIKCDMSIVVKI